MDNAAQVSLKLNKDAGTIADRKYHHTIGDHVSHSIELSDYYLLNARGYQGELRRAFESERELIKRY